MKNFGILSIALIAVALAVITTGCGGQEKVTPTPTSTPAATPAHTPIPTHTSAPAPTPTPPRTPTPPPPRNLREQFVDSFVLAHNSMAEAETLHRDAADEANARAYDSAAAKMAQARTDAERALLDVPSAVVAEMQQLGLVGFGVSEGELADLLTSRITLFIDGAEHFLNSIQCVQGGNATAANDEIDLANKAFGESAQAWSDLYNLVLTDANLRYLRDAVGWKE